MAPAKIFSVAESFQLLEILQGVGVEDAGDVRDHLLLRAALLESEIVVITVTELDRSLLVSLHTLIDKMATGRVVES